MPESAFGFDPETSYGTGVGSTGGGVGGPPGGSPLAPGGTSPLRPDLAEYKKNMESVQQREAEAEQKYEQRMSGALAGLDKAMAGAHPKIPEQAPVKPPPTPQEYQKSSMEWAEAMAVLGAVSSKFTRNVGNASLNAFAGALKGWKEGNQLAYENAAKEWEQSSKQTIENNRAILEKYRLILEDKRLSIDEQMARVRIVGTEYQHDMAVQAAAANNYTLFAQIYDKNVQYTDKAEEKRQTLVDEHRRQTEENQQKATYWLSPIGQTELNAVNPDGTPKYNEGQKAAVKQLVDLYGAKGGAVNFENPGQAPQGVQQRDWDIWADYERMTGKQPNLGWGKEMNAFKARLSLYANERQAAQIPIDPAAQELAGQQAGYQGQIAGAKSLGTRGTNIELAANLASVAIPQALEASDSFPRGRWTPVNAAKLRLAEAGSNVELSKWDIANLQIAEMYARALNPNAYTIRKDMFDRAVGAISEAKSPEAYEATLRSIYQAMQRERQGIAATQKQIAGQTVEFPDPFAARGGEHEGWGELQVH
jgi:hypothetical protein